MNTKAFIASLLILHPEARQVLQLQSLYTIISH